MKEAIGNTMVFNWVIIFLFLIMLLIMGSLMYSRAFKNRNEIITIIEKHRGLTTNAKQEIDQFLRTVGYRQARDFRDRNINTSCQPLDPMNWENLRTDSDFLYCVYKNRHSDLYQVVIFLYLDIPIIGDFVSFPVKGETRVFVDWTSYILE